MDKFQFKVGSKHTNMKGDYEVISIQGESMVIRWNNGDEVTTTIDQQTRILERLEYERNLKDSSS